MASRKRFARVAIWTPQRLLAGKSPADVQTAATSGNQCRRRLLRSCLFLDSVAAYFTRLNAIDDCINIVAWFHCILDSVRFFCRALCSSSMDRLNLASSTGNQLVNICARLHADILHKLKFELRFFIRWDRHCRSADKFCEVATPSAPFGDEISCRSIASHVWSLPLRSSWPTERNPAKKGSEYYFVWNEVWLNGYLDR